MNFILSLKFLIVDNLHDFKLFMNHDPFIFLEDNFSWFFPGILHTILLSIRSCNTVGGLETMRHGLKFIEKGFFTCILDEKNSGNFFIARMIKLSQLDGDKCWKTTFNTQTQKGYIPPLASFQLGHLFF
jgi:hypothetical protein